MNEYHKKNFNKAFSDNRKTVFAVIGAGGKTSYCFAMASLYARTGKKVLITTSTHMYDTKDTVHVASEVKEAFLSRNIVHAGVPVQDNKIMGFSQEEYLQVCDSADVIFVEADGSKGKPFKAPSEYEPVIPENVTRIVLVMGLWAIGKPIKEIGHRIALICTILKKDSAEILTIKDFAFMIKRAYLIPLRENHPGIPIEVLLNHGNTPEQVQFARSVSRIIYGK
jgi:xanthine dehydrogenase accessory factor